MLNPLIRLRGDTGTHGPADNDGFIQKLSGGFAEISPTGDHLSGDNVIFLDVLPVSMISASASM